MGGVEVLDISRTEFKRLMNRKTIVSHMRVNGDADYVLMRCMVTFGMECRNYWNLDTDMADWQLVAFREFDALDDIEWFVEFHNYHSEHFAKRGNQPCAIAFEIWHLVDDDTEVDKLENGKGYDYDKLFELSCSRCDLRYVGDEAIYGDFKSTKRIMVMIGYRDDGGRNLDLIHDHLEWLNLIYGVSSICSEPKWSTDLHMYTCCILLEYSGPASAAWWYGRLCDLSRIQRLVWYLFRVRDVDDYIYYVADRYLSHLMYAFGVFYDDDFADHCDEIYESVLARYPF